MRFAHGLVIAGALCACASQPPNPYFNDQQYLVLGVVPNAEAAALTQQLQALGYQLVQEQDGPDFTALGYADEHGKPGTVRVIGVRGIALALDPTEPDALRDGVSYELLPAPRHGSYDADDDGFDEIFVQQAPTSGEPPCILVYRVRDSGFVDWVPGAGYALAHDPEISDDRWLDPEFCEKEPAHDADGDDEPQAAPAPGAEPEAKSEAKSEAKPEAAARPQPSPAPAHQQKPTPTRIDPRPDPATGR